MQLGVFPFDITSGPSHIGLGATLNSLGDACDNPDHFFDGPMDEVRIWDDIRTSTEIQNNLSQPLVGNEGGLVAYYRFDQDDATDITIPDRSTNNNDGYLG